MRRVNREFFAQLGRANICIAGRRMGTEFSAPSRHRSKKSVLRTGPCLLGLYSLVSLIHARALRGAAPAPPRTPWYTKHDPTFSDALSAVRRLYWESVLKESLGPARVAILPRRLRLTLLDQLSRAP